MDESAVADRLAELRRVVNAGATRGPVTICAVTKGFGADVVALAHRLGCDAIGENYAQEVTAKIAAVGTDHPPVHFIGRLQSNKVRSLVGVVTVWQSVDRESIVDELAKRSPGAHVYIQVNATSEADKGGCEPEHASGLVERARRAGLIVDGLMTVGPTDGNPRRTRDAFAMVRRLADAIGVVGCSMGMSGDVAIALEEGSTMVRVGSALFGERPSATGSPEVI
ncbi:MAG: YggS family pyridoxal phosphate-dependent enzyme [Ilumatobacteraceae bacterium]